jgi:hypothetical protein
MRTVDPWLLLCQALFFGSLIFMLFEVAWGICALRRLEPFFSLSLVCKS